MAAKERPNINFVSLAITDVFLPEVNQDYSKDIVYGW